MTATVYQSRKGPDVATSDDLKRIHARLDEMGDAMQGINTKLWKFVAICEVCRPIVFGNGGKSIDKRVDRLEQTAGRGSKRWSFWAGAAVSLIAGLIGAIAAHLTGAN